MNTGFVKQVSCACIVYMTFSLVGITRGFTNFALDKLLKSMPHITGTEASWIGSLCIFPNPAGSILVGVLMDKLGRKTSIKIATLLFAIGWAVMAFSVNLPMLYVGDVILGISVGMALCSSVYVAEICERYYRCMLLSLFIIFFTLGISLSYLVTYCASWKTSSLVFSGISAVTFVLVHFVPESPYWCVKRGKREEATAALRNLRSREGCDIGLECQDIASALSKSAPKKKFTMNDVVDSRKALSIFVLFQICLQGSGYSVLIAYSSQIFSKILPTLSEEHLKMFTMGYALVTFVSSFLSPFAVSCWSRKILIKISGVSMTSSMLIILAFHHWSLLHSNIVIPACFAIYVFTCTIGSVTLSECMPSELYRTEVRGLMCGITQAFATILTGTLIYSFPMQLAHLPIHYILAAFAFFSFATLLFGTYILPETKGKSLDEIQKSYFAKGMRHRSSSNNDSNDTFSESVNEKMLDAL